MSKIRIDAVMKTVESSKDSVNTVAKMFGPPVYTCSNKNYERIKSKVNSLVEVMGWVDKYAKGDISKYKTAITERVEDLKKEIDRIDKIAEEKREII